MSDGPYKTLKMSRPWKRLAKLASNPAHSIAEVAEAFRPALLDDWGKVRPAFAQEVRAALGDNDRGNLFREVTLAETQRLSASASNPAEALLADQARDAARDGLSGAPAYEQVVKGFFDERALQRSRQMEEHFAYEQSPDARRLRAKLNEAFGDIGTGHMAVGVASGAGVRSLAPKVDRTGLDEGVPL